MAGELDLLARASAMFGETVAKVTDDDLDKATFVEGWDVKALIAHLVLGDAVVTDALSGRSVEAITEFDPAILGPSPLTSWRGTALAMIKAFEGDEVMESMYSYAGADLTGRQLLGFRVSDALVHGFDLATAIGQPVGIADDAAEFALETWLPLLQSVEDPTFVGDGPIEPAEDASSTVRLLALFGRSA